MLNAGCSRRAIFKQRKLCHQCHRKPASLVEGDSNEQLRFCSASCIQNYKMDIFTTETLACLKTNEQEDGSPMEEAEVGSDSDNTSKNNGSSSHGKCTRQGRSSGARPKAAPSLGTVTPKTRPSKRRANQQRPHPSYALNKRYWEEMKLKNNTNTEESKSKPKSNEPMDAVADTTTCRLPVEQCIQSPKVVNPTPTSLVLPPMPPLRQMPPLSTNAPMLTTHCIHGCPSIYIPVPIPIPVPFPVPMEKFAESVVMMKTFKK